MMNISSSYQIPSEEDLSEYLNSMSLNGSQDQQLVNSSEIITTPTSKQDYKTRRKARKAIKKGNLSTNDITIKENKSPAQRETTCNLETADPKSILKKKLKPETSNSEKNNSSSTTLAKAACVIRSPSSIITTSTPSTDVSHTPAPFVFKSPGSATTDTPTSSKGVRFNAGISDDSYRNARTRFSRGLQKKDRKTTLELLAGNG